MDVIGEITKGLPRNRRWRVEADFGPMSWPRIREVLGLLMRPSRWNDQKGTGDIAHFHCLQQFPLRVEITFDPLPDETPLAANLRVNGALAAQELFCSTSLATLCTEFD